jgi:hypothetical protein
VQPAQPDAAPSHAGLIGRNFISLLYPVLTRRPNFEIRLRCQVLGIDCDGRQSKPPAYAASTS